MSAVIEGGASVPVICQPPNSDTDFLVWQGVDVNGQTIPLNYSESNGYSTLSAPTDAAYNQSVFRCDAYLITSFSLPITVVTAHILLQGIYIYELYG